MYSENLPDTGRQGNVWPGLRKQRLIWWTNALILILLVLLIVCSSFISEKTYILSTLGGRNGICQQKCLFQGHSMNVTPAVHMTSFKGFGRTGNYIRAMNRAVSLAYVCKLQVKLPDLDDESGALPINATFAHLDFSERQGPVPNACADLKLPIVGNAAFFWNFHMIIPEEQRFQALLQGSSGQLTETCIQKYLGICDAGFCENLQVLKDTASSTLVVHVREGDIFKTGNTSVDAPCYGQPPLSYYIQAMMHESWGMVVVVGEPGHFGPIRSALASMRNNKSFIPDTEVVFQSNTWSVDLRTLMCAPYLVTARTSLIPLLNLGFARRIYSYSCLNFSTDKEHYIIGVENYPYWKFHDGGHKERVDLLIHRASVPWRCNSNSVAPEEPDTCLPYWMNASVL